jgi:hypothetical protein
MDFGELRSLVHSEGSVLLRVSCILFNEQLRDDQADYVIGHIPRAWAVLPDRYILVSYVPPIPSDPLPDRGGSAVWEVHSHAAGVIRVTWVEADGRRRVALFGAYTIDIHVT